MFRLTIYQQPHKWLKILNSSKHLSEICSNKRGDLW